MGIAEIVTAMQYFMIILKLNMAVRWRLRPMKNGRGADKFDVQKFGADWGYTVDGGEIGELEYENFNAVFGVQFKDGMHSGYAKNKTSMHCLWLTN